MEHVWQAVFSGGITLLVMVAFHALVTSRSGRVAKLESRVGELETQEIASLRSGQEHASDRRGEIYKRLEERVIGTGICRTHRENLERRIGAAERITRVVQAELGEIKTELAGTATVTRLIAARLQITLPDEGKPRGTHGPS